MAFMEPSFDTDVENAENFKPFILPQKTVFQLCNLLQETNQNVQLYVADSKIQFKIIMLNSIMFQHLNRHFIVSAPRRV